MAISKLTDDRKLEIANYMRDNPNMTYVQYMENCKCSRPQILKIRKNFGFKLRTVPHLEDDELDKIRHYIECNPQTKNTILMKMFNCNKQQISGIRKRYGLTLFKQRDKITLEKSDMIAKYMKENLHIGYVTLTKMFNCSSMQIRLIRKKYNLPSVKESIDKYNKENPPLIPKRRKTPKSKSLEDFLEFKLNESKRRIKLHGSNTLTLDDLFYHYNKQNGKCYYSGRDLKLTINDINSLSIDRVDSSKNYSKENIVLCCSGANFMKWKYTQQDFIEICKDIATKNSNIAG